MNNILNLPQHNLPTDTPSGCFSNFLHCLLCGGTVSTRSSVSSPTQNPDSLQNDNQVQMGNLLLPDRQRLEAQVPLPIVARLMGLETPVDMNWKPRVINESFNRRSRSVNAVDCLFLPRLISPESERRSGVVHRRVKTCLSFQESDFLVVCLEKNSNSNFVQCDQKRVKDPRADLRCSEGNKHDRKKKVSGRKPNRFEQTGHLTVRIESKAEHNNQLKMATDKAKWQNKDDYYQKPLTAKSQRRRKETQSDVVNRSSKLKATKHRKDMNLSSNSGFQQSSVSGRLSSNCSQSRKIKGRADNVRIRSEEKRRSRKSKIAENRDAESFGEAMIEKMKSIVEDDLEMRKWDWENEGGFLYREYLSMVIELGILDEIVNQIVQLINKLESKEANRSECILILN